MDGFATATAGADGCGLAAGHRNQTRVAATTATQTNAKRRFIGYVMNPRSLVEKRLTLGKTLGRSVGLTPNHVARVAEN